MRGDGSGELFEVLAQLRELRARVERSGAAAPYGRILEVPPAAMWPGLSAIDARYEGTGGDWSIACEMTEEGFPLLNLDPSFPVAAVVRAGAEGTEQTLTGGYYNAAPDMASALLLSPRGTVLHVGAEKARITLYQAQQPPLPAAQTWQLRVTAVPTWPRVSYVSTDTAVPNSVRCPRYSTAMWIAGPAGMTVSQVDGAGNVIVPAMAVPAVPARIPLARAAVIVTAAGGPTTATIQWEILA